MAVDCNACFNTCDVLSCSIAVLNQKRPERTEWKESAICTKSWNNSVLQFVKVSDMCDLEAGFLHKCAVGARFGHMSIRCASCCMFPLKPKMIVSAAALLHVQCFHHIRLLLS
jgi:hypothetical protein